MSIENKDIPDQSEHKEQFEDAEVMLDVQKNREAKQLLVQMKEELSWLQDKITEGNHNVSESSDIAPSSPHPSTKNITEKTNPTNAFVKSRIDTMNPGSSTESNRGREQAYTSVSNFVTTSIAQLPFGLHKFFLDA